MWHDRNSSPVCICQDDDHPSSITSPNCCVLWNVHNNYHVSYPSPLRLTQDWPRYFKLPRNITRPQEFTFRSVFHVNDISSQDHHWTRGLQIQIPHAGYFFCSHVVTDFASSDKEETICKVSTLSLLPIQSSHRGMQGNVCVMCFCVFKMAPLFDQSQQSSSTFFFGLL